MHNLAEQKKLVAPIITTIIMVVIFVAFFCVFYLNYFKPNINLFGYKVIDFMDDVKQLEYDEVDEGERAFFIKKGSKVLFDSQVTPSKLEKNDVFAYWEKVDGVTVYKVQIFLASEEPEEGKPRTYHSHNLDSFEENVYTIDSDKYLGKLTNVIGGLGYVTHYLTMYQWLAYISPVIILILFTIIPICVAAVRFRNRKRGSAFPEGVNAHNLSSENLYIYTQIRSFIIDEAKMSITNGYDCDLIYIGKRLFGILHCTNGHIYVNINKNFQRYDNRVDRAGYIVIPHASNLPKAKMRINDMYRAYFLDVGRANFERKTNRNNA